MDIELLDGEVICPKCEGTGEDKNSVFVCGKCLGDKKMDWISAAMGQIKKNLSSLDKLNVRRLYNHIQKQLNDYEFQVNNETTMNNMVNMIQQTLEIAQGTHVINDYNIERIDNNIDISVKPTRSVDIVKMNVMIT